MAIAAVVVPRIPAQDLTVACASRVGELLREAGPTQQSMPLWIIRQDSPPTYRRNRAVWTGADVSLTGKAVWNSRGGTFGTTAISPLHVVYANHPVSLYPPGTLIRFVDDHDQVVERRVRSSVAIGSTDIDLSTLDRPLPPSIHWFKVMPRHWFLACRRRPPGSDGGLPCVVLDANSQSAIVKDISGFNGQSFYTGPSTGLDRRPFTKELHGGDSGSPMFLLLGHELVLDGIYHWAVGGPELSESIGELNAAMAASGYRVTVADLKGIAAVPASLAGMGQ